MKTILKVSQKGPTAVVTKYRVAKLTCNPPQVREKSLFANAASIVDNLKQNEQKICQAFPLRLFPFQECSENISCFVKIENSTQKTYLN